MGKDQIYLRRRYGKHNYVETQMRENHGERERIHYNNGDYNSVLWSARVFEIDPLPH